MEERIELMKLVAFEVTQVSPVMHLIELGQYIILKFKHFCPLILIANNNLLSGRKTSKCCRSNPPLTLAELGFQKF